ncbi:DUF397 domain-containing protein [Nocardiopsis sp. ARC36]
MKAFHKSTWSANGGECVEVSEGEKVRVRDTQNRELGHLTVPAPEWTALVSVLRGK